MDIFVLLVDDDPAVRMALSQTLELSDFKTVVCGSFVEAKDHIIPNVPCVILTDIRMQGRDGFFLLEYAQKADAEIPVIMLTGEGDIPMAVRAISQGAFDFLEKPCPTEDMIRVIERAISMRKLVLENRRLKEKIKSSDPASRIIFGVSEKSEILRDTVRKAAHTGSEVLVYGEKGTGITKVSEVIHLVSDRSLSPFVRKAAKGLTASDVSDVAAQAQDGTLFLYAIEAMDMDAQLELVTVLDSGAKFRLVAGTNESLVDLKHYLTDELYYRLTTTPVRIPSLSERPEDIPVMFRNFVAQAADQSGRTAPEISSQVLSDLISKNWEGNTQALFSHAMQFVLGVQDISPDELGLSEKMAQVEKTLLEEALRKNAGNATSAAALLKVPRKTFYDKLAKYGIRAEEFRT